MNPPDEPDHDGYDPYDVDPIEPRDDVDGAEPFDLDDEDEILAAATSRRADLEHKVQALQDHVEWLTETVNEIAKEKEAAEKRRRFQPADWVTYTPPAIAGQHPNEDEHHGFTIANFVAWYNTIYVGLPGSRSIAIPPCWAQHPGLVAEIGTLCFAWIEANIGATAHPHRAQLWHHHDRPGFADRLRHEWTHPHCHDEHHKPAGAPSRADRYRLNINGEEE